jgi:hypothetical protein
MADIISFILIILSVATFLASSILLFFSERIGLPVSEWVVFIFISFMILLSQIISLFDPGFDLSSRYLVMTISVAIFILAIGNYWQMLSEYGLTKRLR